MENLQQKTSIRQGEKNIEAKTNRKLLEKNKNESLITCLSTWMKKEAAKLSWRSPVHFHKTSAERLTDI